MLIKIGDVWVVPEKVDFLGRDGLLCVNGVSVYTDPEKTKDEYASIINNALGQQSYGGEVEEEKPAS